ncbi:hypothetical protein WN943_023138 [Citrus x changshan-huyou]
MAATPNRQFKNICVLSGFNYGKHKEFVEAAIDLGRSIIERKLHLVYGGDNRGLSKLFSEAAFVRGSQVLGIFPSALKSLGSLSDSPTGEEGLAAEKGHEKKKKKSIVLKASKHESDKESELDDEEMEKKEQISCYECKKPGHIWSECPLLNKFKKKAMVATWDDSDEETSDDEKHQEMTNLALIAIGEK